MWDITPLTGTGPGHFWCPWCGTDLSYEGCSLSDDRVTDHLIDHMEASDEPMLIAKEPQIMN